MQDEQKDLRDEILNEGTEGYVSVLYCVEQYKEGNCPLSSVEASMKAALDEYFEKRSMELLEYMAVHFVTCTNTDNDLDFYYNGEWITKEQLFNNFL